MQINISDEIKLSYFNYLLENDDDAKQKFMSYLTLQEQINKPYKNQDLDSRMEELFQLFDNVDLELHMPSCSNHYDGYYHEEDISEELCSNLFIEIAKELEAYVKKEDYFQALFLLLAIVKAIDLQPNIEDDYGLIYDYQEILSEYNFYFITSFIMRLKDVSFSYEDKKKFILFLLENSDSFDELKPFEELFYLLIRDKKIAQFASTHIKEFHINIQLTILELLEENEAYIEATKQFYQQNNTIAMKLLAKLNELSRYEEYEAVAKECYNKSASSFASQIVRVITYEKSKDFYLDVLKYLVLNNQNIDEYLLYKKYLSKEEITLIQKDICEHSWSYDYCIKILKYEKEYDKILQLAHSNFTIDLRTVLTPIKFHFPQECYNIIVARCDKLMQGYDRNRKTYHKICNYLTIITEVTPLKQKIDAYIKEKLINRSPTLPALKDELSKAGLL